MVDDKGGGLTDLEVKEKGVYLQRRPSPDHKARKDASFKAHDEWLERKEAFEAEQDALAAAPADATPEGGKPKKRKKRRKKFKEPEPELVDGPIPVSFDEVTIQTNTLDLGSDALDGIMLNDAVQLSAHAVLMAVSQRL